MRQSRRIAEHIGRIRLSDHPGIRGRIHSLTILQSGKYDSVPGFMAKFYLRVIGPYAAFTAWFRLSCLGLENEGRKWHAEQELLLPSG